jgi:hypothetical protein
MITLGPNLVGLKGTQVTSSIIYTLVSSPWDSTRIVDSGWISNLHIFDLINLLTSSSSCKNNQLSLYYFARGFGEQAWQLWRIKRPVNCRSRYLSPTSNSIPLDLNLGNWSNPFFCRIEYFVKLNCWFIIFILSLCCLWSCMLSVASRYLGWVDASDSKREYLCSIVGSWL